MAVEVAQHTMEAYVQDLLGGPYKRHFSDDVVVTLVGTDQGPKDQTRQRPGYTTSTRWPSRPARSSRA